MSIYLMNCLNLPDVIELDIIGGGEIIDENEKIYIVYESTSKGYLKYSKDWKNEEWIEEDEKDEQNSGRKELFTD